MALVIISILILSENVSKEQYLNTFCVGGSHIIVTFDVLQFRWKQNERALTTPINVSDIRTLDYTKTPGLTNLVFLLSLLR